MVSKADAVFRGGVATAHGSGGHGETANPTLAVHGQSRELFEGDARDYSAETLQCGRARWRRTPPAEVRLRSVPSRACSKPEKLRDGEKSRNDQVRLLRRVLDAEALPFCQIDFVESFKRVFAAFAHNILPVVRVKSSPIRGTTVAPGMWEQHSC